MADKEYRITCDACGQEFILTDCVDKSDLCKLVKAGAALVERLDDAMSRDLDDDLAYFGTAEDQMALTEFEELLNDWR